jgi:hypothetical protein
MSQPYEYYIEKEFSSLAGPYSMQSKKEREHLQNVINDMKRGKIEYRIVDDKYGEKIVERRGMILPKRK